MRRTVLIILILFSLPEMVFIFQSASLNAQEVCTDTIYPLKSKGIISECCIEKVENENFVIYKRKGQNYGIEARAIIKGGLYIPLTNPQNTHAQFENPKETPQVQKVSNYKYSYEVYSKRYRTGKTVATIGGFVAVMGVAMTIGSSVSYNNGNMTYEDAETLIVVGFFAFNFGVPTSIIGLAMASKSKKAMIRTRKQSLDISMGITGNGVGLVMKF